MKSLSEAVPADVAPGRETKQAHLARMQAKATIKRNLDALRVKSHRVAATQQPRDSVGRFRKILARLKTNLGDSELNQIVDEVNKADKASVAGNYRKASEAGANVVQMIGKIQAGSLDVSTRNGLRRGAAELGRVLAYLPLPQGSDTQTVRFSDLPPSTGRLIREMIKKLEEKLDDQDKFAELTYVLNSFMSGVRSMTADDLSAELNKILRFVVN